MSARKIGLCVVGTCLLAGCSLFDNDRWQGNDPDKIYRTNDPYHTDPQYSGQGPDPTGRRYAGVPQDQGIFGGLFGGSGNTNNAAPSGVGVNSYLWRATLDTVSFMPLASADPFGGVIITDWYSPPESQAERFKVNIFILGRELRADGVRASVFRQHRDGAGAWTDAPVDQATGTDLENAILTRARQLRLSTASK
jgi:hypothetical protein